MADEAEERSSSTRFRDTLIMPLVELALDRSDRPAEALAGLSVAIVCIARIMGLTDEQLIGGIKKSLGHLGDGSAEDVLSRLHQEPKPRTDPTEPPPPW
jgi:hypothetical protein